MLLKCTADGRPIKVNGAPVSHGNGARDCQNENEPTRAISSPPHTFTETDDRSSEHWNEPGPSTYNVAPAILSRQERPTTTPPMQFVETRLEGMKMTMSTAPTMSARVHRKVMRAPHKRPHPGKMAHAVKMAHPGKMSHPGKFAHLGKFGKLAHYAHTHSLRPPEPCENSNDSGLGPDPLNRLSDILEPEWEHSESKRQRRESDMAVKLESEDANDTYPFPPAGAMLSAAAPAPPDAPPTTLHTLAPAPAPLSVIRAGCSLTSPSITENTGKRFQDPYTIRSCGKPGGGGKLATKYSTGGKLSGGGKMGGKLTGKYGGKLAMARKRALMAQAGRPGLASPLGNRSRDGTVELQILCQPETQHRARYQTEGSRGAVKDNSGNGFPVVKLVGYDKPAVLQVYIGTDAGRVAPHMFYQACRVAGKNSTPCKERKDDGTVLIEIDLDSTKNWQVTCDCVGILKERNVDVEHRFGEALGGGGAGASHMSRGKKKSTRCRMVFRTDIVTAAGDTETLQVCSTQIICTQPPGVPEVCRKSLVSCPATGGLELYLLGKNFLKESRVVFAHTSPAHRWEEEVVPDKEFLQQTHLVCCVPPYYRTDISEAVCVQIYVRSGGKSSEPHAFYYTPPTAAPVHATHHHAQGEEARPVLVWGGMMPPPPLPVRRPSIIVPDPHSPLGLKSEVDDSSQHSLADRSESCGADGPDKLSPGHSGHSMMSDDLSVVDLRLKSENMHDSQQQVNYSYDPIKLSPSTSSSESQSPLASFTQQLQAIQTQVQTDKMVESVTAAIFNTDAAPMYPAMPIMADSMTQLISTKSETDMKVLNPELMITESRMPVAAENTTLLTYRREDTFNPFGAMTKLEMETNQIEERLARQSAHMEALVEDAMKATAAMLPADAAKLDELVNSRVDDHLAATPTTTSANNDDLMMLPDQVQMTSVKTPPAAVKSMILSAAAEILTSDSTMNALVTSAINTANILSETDPPPAEPAGEAPLVAMSQAVSQAVTQAVSQAVSHAVSQAVSQEMTAPVQGLTDMSDQDLLSYINPSTFDQV